MVSSIPAGAIGNSEAGQNSCICRVVVLVQVAFPIRFNLTHARPIGVDALAPTLQIGLMNCHCGVAR